MSYTLDQLRSDVEKRFTPFEIQVSDDYSVKLANLVRVGKEKREEIGVLLEKLDPKDADASEEDIRESAEGIFRLLADDAKAAETLIEKLDGDVALLIGLLEKWMEATGLGEASSSQS